MTGKDRYIRFSRETMKKGFGVEFGEDDEVLELAADANTCLVQHGLGGLMTSLSGFGITSIFSTRTTFALARHGNLSELGWETQDLIIRVHDICFGGELGRKKNPLGLIAMLLIHHTAALCMVLPLNLYYPEYKDGHELSCLLQLAAATAIFFQQYGYTLDVNEVRDLLKMKITVTVSYVIIIWSRIVRYFPLLWNLIATFRKDENWFVYKLSCVPAVCLTLFNVIIVIDATYKLCKFLPVTLKDYKKDDIIDHGTDAASANVVMRRASSYFGLSKSEGGWEKIREMVKTGVFHDIAEKQKKEN